MKSFGVFLVIVLALLAFFALLIHDDQCSREEATKWLEFSMKNHCRIVRESSFSNPTTLWQCDGGFQVKH